MLPLYRHLPGWALLLLVAHGCGVGGVVPASGTAGLGGPFMPAPDAGTPVLPFSGPTSPTAEPNQVILPPVDPNQTTPMAPTFDANMWLRTVTRAQNPNAMPGIFRLNNSRWVGRGPVINDPRNCDACTNTSVSALESIGRINRAVDVDKANYLRLALESYPTATTDQNPNIHSPRTSWESVLFDAAYFNAVVQIINHIGTKPGVYVELSLWRDQSFTTNGKLWPTADSMGSPGSQCAALQAAHIATTTCVWQKLATAFKSHPYVIFNIDAEPAHQAGSSEDAASLALHNACVQTIRNVEAAAGTRRHVVTVSGSEYGRRLAYYADSSGVQHPITVENGNNVAYQSHPYNPPSDFQTLFMDTAQWLPVIIGEFGPNTVISNMDIVACDQLVALCEANDFSYTAWAYTTNCSDAGLLNMLKYPSGYTPTNICNGSSAAQLQLTGWGQHFMTQVRTGNGL